MKAYITCPVSHSDARLKLLPEIKAVTDEKGIDSFIFEIGGEPKDIFARDYEQVKSCDLIIADVSEPSHGVGIEIGISYCLGLKRILLYEKLEGDGSFFQVKLGILINKLQNTNYYIHDFFYYKSNRL